MNLRLQLTGTPRKPKAVQSTEPQSPQVKKSMIKDAHPYQYPKIIRSATPNDKHTTKYLGDLHANWVSLDMQLIEAGLIEQSEKNFEKLCEVHKAPQPVLLKDYLEGEISGEDAASVNLREKKFELAKIMYKRDLTIVKEAFRKNTKVLNKDLHLGLGGDETCDREGNDAYFMEMVEFLVDEGCKLDKIMVSNHGIDFLYALKFKKCELYTGDHGLPFDTFSVQAGYATYSLQNLGKFMEWGIVSKERVMRFIDNYYIPRLMLVDIIRDKEREDAVTFVTHASMWPTSENPVLFLNELFDKFNVKCDLKKASAKELVEAINEVNVFFRKLVMDEEAHELLIEAFSDDDDILRKLIWNREKDTPVKAKTHLKYSMVNGHDSVLHEKDLSPELESMHACIDHEVGKRKEGGDYVPQTLHSVEITSSETPEKKVEKKKRRMAGLFLPMEEPHASSQSESSSEESSVRPGHAKADQ